MHTPHHAVRPNVQREPSASPDANPQILRRPTSFLSSNSFRFNILLLCAATTHPCVGASPANPLNSCILAVYSQWIATGRRAARFRMASFVQNRGFPTTHNLQPVFPERTQSQDRTLRIFASPALLLLLSAAPAWTQPPVIADCHVFPPDNIWNRRIDHLPIDPNSAQYVATIGADKPLVPDFGAGLFQGGPIGIPFVVVTNQPGVPIVFTDYGDESDPGPYPVPPQAPIEGGPQSKGDRHVLTLDRDHCILYELFNAFPQPDGSWKASSGAIFNLASNALRPAGWTSADAAGFPVVPGLVRYDEAAAGAIHHAIRFTVPQSRRAYVWPATHFASSLTDPKYPPMGQRFRLRADFDLSGFSPPNQVILRALQQYGMMIADNGSAWFISGAPDDRWDNNSLRELRRVHGSDFEAVDSSPLEVAPDSGAVKGERRRPIHR
jgi:hypothetical protein